MRRRPYLAANTMAAIKSTVPSTLKIHMISRPLWKVLTKARTADRANNAASRSPNAAG